MAKQRLQKVLAAAGIDSRRNCEELILDGVVRVNKKVVDTLPVFVDPEIDVITVNGRKIRAENKIYFLLHKPKGVICTNSDPMGRKKAIDIIRTPQRIFCVGRLDADSTGAIILTNDSELTNKLTHPRYELPKTYEVKIKGMIETKSIEKLKKGVWLAEGKTQCSLIKILKKGPKESIIELKIRQGMNRQVRRMLAKVYLPVKSLKRTAIGKINLKGIGPGNYRKLKPAEIAYLQKTTSKK